MTKRPIRVLTIGHSYVVALNQQVPAALARNPSIDLTLAAPTFHYGDLRRIHLEKRHDPAYRIVALDARMTSRNHIFWYAHRPLRRLITEGDFDIVHAWEEPYTYSGYQIARATRGTNSKFVFLSLQNIMKRYPWPFRHFERETVRHADAWIAGGHLVREAMVAKGFPEDTARVIPLAVDTSAFTPPTAAEKHSVLEELGLSPPVIGFVGRLVQEKGLSVLMEALERIELPWSLLALGSGPYKEVLEEWANIHGFGDRVQVRFALHEDVPRYLAATDVLVAPSQTLPNWKEQFGRMLVEAFACRVPVIGSDSGEIPFVIGEAGVVVPEADTHQWRDAIADLLTDDAKRERLATAGYRRAMTCFSVDRVADQHLELFAQLSEGRHQ